jgi:hypothetical protein
VKCRARYTVVLAVPILAELKPIYLASLRVGEQNNLTMKGDEEFKLLVLLSGRGDCVKISRRIAPLIWTGTAFDQNLSKTMRVHKVQAHARGPSLP